MIDYAENKRRKLKIVATKKLLEEIKCNWKEYFFQNSKHRSNDQLKINDIERVIFNNHSNSHRFSLPLVKFC